MNIILLLILLISKLAVAQVCETCQNLVEEFRVGLKDSEKGNFGGGNTAWEEERLGNFATSETRLVHIVDGLCPSKLSNREKCQYMREELEEHIEKWWFNIYKKENSADSLYHYLCVDHLKACCPNNHYGKACDRCPHYDNMTGVVCSGHGKCSGNRTRDGDGSCICDDGYSGEVCANCQTTHYKSSNTCLQCDPSCIGCSGPLSTNCEVCAAGYQNVNGKCDDVDECSNTSVPACVEGQYCVNKAGTHECAQCDPSCTSCSGPSSSGCLSCSEGYQSVQGKCEDVNECSADSQLCRGSGERCTNTAGGYTCDCIDGHRREAPKGPCLPGKERATPEGTRRSQGEGERPRQATPRGKRQTKKIWTRRFEREFFKLVAGVLALGLVSYLLGRRHPVVVLAAALACGYFVYHKSIRLDLIFSKSVFV